MVADEATVRVLGARCSTCSRDMGEWWQLRIDGAPVPLRLFYPFVTTPEAVRHFITQRDGVTPTCRCGNTISLETEPA